MTNEELFDDLKQFIDAKFSQQVANLATKDDLANLATKSDLETLGGRVNRLDERFDEMDEKLNEIQNAIGEHGAQVDDTLRNHEQRITRLEHRSA